MAVRVPGLPGDKVVCYSNKISATPPSVVTSTAMRKFIADQRDAQNKRMAFSERQNMCTSKAQIKLNIW